MLGTSDGASVSYFLADLALPAGYRWRKNHLVSLSPGFRMASLSGSTLARSGSVTQFGASLGYQIELESLILRFEPSWNTGSFGEVQTGGWGFGAAVSFQIARAP